MTILWLRPFSFPMNFHYSQRDNTIKCDADAHNKHSFPKQSHYPCSEIDLICLTCSSRTDGEHQMEIDDEKWIFRRSRYKTHVQPGGSIYYVSTFFSIEPTYSSLLWCSLLSCYFGRTFFLSIATHNRSGFFFTEK